MNGHYDPEFDSPEARANYATRHILNLVERARRRRELLEQFRAEPVVRMFPAADAALVLSRKVRITVDGGLRAHSIEISVGDWRRVQAGEVMRIAGAGYAAEGGDREQDFWRFNDGGKVRVMVYCETGRVVFEGRLDGVGPTLALRLR